MVNIMKMKYIYMMLFVGLSILVACDPITDAEPNIRKVEIIDGSGEDNYFPNQPGYYWVYKVVNPGNHVIDELKISVTENLQSDGK